MNSVATTLGVLLLTALLLCAILILSADLLQRRVTLRSLLGWRLVRFQPCSVCRDGRSHPLGAGYSASHCTQCGRRLPPVVRPVCAWCGGSDHLTESPAGERCYQRNKGAYGPGPLLCLACMLLVSSCDMRATANRSGYLLPADSSKALRVWVDSSRAVVCYYTRTLEAVSCLRL